jgi:hypothetical protein
MLSKVLDQPAILLTAGAPVDCYANKSSECPRAVNHYSFIMHRNLDLPGLVSISSAVEEGPSYLTLFLVWIGLLNLTSLRVFLLIAFETTLFLTGVL